MSKPKNSIISKFLTRAKIVKYGYEFNKGFPLEIREGGDKSIWLLSSYFLLKLSLRPQLILKKDLLNYTPKNILKIFNRINPRCWKIIKHSVYQKELSEIFSLCSASSLCTILEISMPMAVSLFPVWDRLACD